jgi:hypothetical protein
VAGTYVYVDGFNLYNRALKGTPNKWLDLAALADKVLGHPVTLVRYFTARISAMPHDPNAPVRQQALLRAYGTQARIKLHYGQFKPRTKRGEGLKPNTVPADFYKTLRHSDLASCHLPNPITDASGRKIHRPTGW